MIPPSVGPYHIVKRLGTGGMGEVYVAEDSRLGRRVALKSLTGSRVGTPESRTRLLHEARAAATLTHPNIAAIHDVIEVDDRAYIVMEYVDGETLEAVIARGPVPVDEAIRIVTELAEALTEAHAHGIIHRDLKPANLMLTRAGKVKILDFGIARVRPPDTAERAAASTVTHLTLTDQIVGTPGYMAPEQMVGGSVDHRADVYGLGLVLFELLSGKKPFDAPDAFGRALAAWTSPPPSARALNRAVPAELDAVIARAMAREPAERFQSAAEMQAALAGGPETAEVPPASSFPSGWSRGRLAIGLTLAIVAVLSAWAWLGRGSRLDPVAAGGPTVVAVLPLENQTGDPAKAYLGAGVAETIRTSLAVLPSLVVVPRAEVIEATTTMAAHSEIARTLGASFLVSGSVQQAGEQLGVNLQLVSAGGEVAWGQRFEGQVEALFDLQRRMVGGLASVLRVETGPAGPVPAKAGTGDPAAVAEYWQGRLLLDRRDLPGNTERAIESFQAAIALDPSLAVAHAGLAEAYWAQYLASRDAHWTELAIEAGQAAVRLDSDEPQGHFALAVVYHGSGRLTEATDALRRVRDLRPTDADAPRLLGDILADQGEIDEAVVEFNKAIALRPNYWENHSQLGLTLFNASRYVEAEQAFLTVTELAPESARGFQMLGTLYHTVGDLDRALVNYRESIRRSPYAPAYSNMGSILYGRGRYDEAVDAYQQAIALRPNRPVTHRNLGDAYTRLGRLDDATVAYTRAVELTEDELRVNPRDAQNLSRLAVYEAKLARYDDARRHAGDAEQLLPDDATIRFRKAVVYALAGNADVALAELKAAVDAGYSVALIREEDDLVSLRELPEFDRLIRDGP